MKIKSHKNSAHTVPHVLCFKILQRDGLTEILLLPYSKFHNVCIIKAVQHFMGRGGGGGGQKSLGAQKFRDLRILIPLAGGQYTVSFHMGLILGGGGYIRCKVHTHIRTYVCRHEDTHSTYTYICHRKKIKSTHQLIEGYNLVIDDTVRHPQLHKLPMG